MIRLTEEVIAETQKRNCSPLETFVFGIRLKMWPPFQKLMAENIDAVKKYAEGAAAGYFRRGAATMDDTVANVRCGSFQDRECEMLMWIQVCRRYVELFNSFIVLTAQAEETMIFSK